MRNSTWRGLAALIVFSGTLVSYAQSYDNMSADNSRTLVKEYYEGPSVLTSKDYQYQFTKPSVSKEGTYVRTGRAGEFGWVHYRNLNQFRYDSLAGRKLICDKATDLPLQIVGCKNLIWQRSTKTETRTLNYERTKVREYETTRTVPGPTRTVEVPGPERFFPVLLLAPQQQYIANLSSPTVIAPVLNGIPGFSYAKSNFSVVGGNATGGLGGSATGGTGGNGYGAAAAAAAAAATAAAVGITPTSGVGATGSTSGTSGSSAGGGGSDSGSKKR